MMNLNKKVVLALIAVLVAAGLVSSWLMLSAFSSLEGKAYLFVDKDDNLDSVYVKLQKSGKPNQMAGIRMGAFFSNYKNHIRPGRYAIGEGLSSLSIVRSLRGGRQVPVNLVVPVVHTLNDMAGRLTNNLAMDSVTFMSTVYDPVILKELDVDTASVAALFIPNTYQVYWDISPKDLMLRMKSEHDKFWNEERRELAEKIGYSPLEVSIIASIVEQESANENERPMIAGMYVNRLKTGMKLQADPTVKFALGDFGLRRIMHNHLLVDSPYNTYKYEGLPLGPICVPSINAIESVLNYVKHPYLYMCAKEDFSGTHNFAETYDEHLKNARKYAEALNRRGIK